MSNADLARIINSTEVQSVVRTKNKKNKYSVHKKNPLRNLGAMVKLNPYAIKAKRLAIKASSAPAKKVVDKAADKLRKKSSKAFYNTLVSDDFVSSKQ
jgi:large subunit ribosomal protein L4e